MCSVFCLLTNLAAAIILVNGYGEYEFARLSFERLAKKYGHHPEVYEVETTDGYILTLFRLPGSRSIPVLLQHGILDSSLTWILRGNNSLGISLANAKHDVWLSNLRGNTLSRKHVRLNPDEDPAFWDYNLDDLGTIDLPAIADKILSITGAKRLNAIGHSMGNTIFYILGSRKPQYNSKINVMIALAPVCFMHDLQEPLPWLFENANDINAILAESHIHELFGRTTPQGYLFKQICMDRAAAYDICYKAGLFQLTGTSDTTEINPDFTQVASKYFPAGISRKVALHYSQIGRRRRFQRFDYVTDNSKVYNASDPPEYNLGRVTMRLVLVAGQNDKLSSLKNVNLLRSRLPNVVDYIVHPRKRFSHLDFTWGKRTKDTLFPYIFYVLNKFSFRCL
ncbi:lipase 1-like [Zerene cesonia]|uniref:lipase 1-like n=1 Tax=Zerene cesonia TaxID=33412 RepID=UPI0018E568A9|nr:lipase 1-like [Zerene cesonia]